MQPSSIASRLRRATTKGRSSPVATCRRSRYSMVIGCGNLGARPQPPFRASNCCSIGCVGGAPQQRLDDLAARLLDTLPILPPRLGGTFDDLAEAGHAMARLVRE